MIVTFTKILDRYEEEIETKTGFPKSRKENKKGKVIHVCKMDGKKDRELYDVMFKDGTIWSLEPEQIKKETK